MNDDDEDLGPRPEARWRVVHVYTRFRRHEMMSGKIGDIPIPAAHWWQPLIGAMALFALWFLRDLWSPLPLTVRVVLILGGPVVAYFVSGRFASNPFATVWHRVCHLRGRYARPPRHLRPVRSQVVVPAVDDSIDAVSWHAAWDEVEAADREGAAA